MQLDANCIEQLIRVWALLLFWSGGWGGWEEKWRLKLSQLSTKLKLKLKLSLAISHIISNLFHHHVKTIKKIGKLFVKKISYLPRRGGGVPPSRKILGKSLTFLGLLPLVFEESENI